MDLNRTIVEGIIVYLIFDLVILRLIFTPFVNRQREKGKGKRYIWGIYLTTLGIILTAFGLFLAVISLTYQGWKINTGMIAGITPFIAVGIPCLAIGIFFIHNP